MSQRENASLPASRRSSRSPPGNVISPEHVHYDKAGEAHALARFGGGGLQQDDTSENRSRSRSAIDNVLNPTGVQSAASEARTALSFGAAVTPTPLHNAPPVPLQHSLASEQATGYGFAARPLDAPRRILSPTGPRSASASHAFGASHGSPRLLYGLHNASASHPPDHSTPSSSKPPMPSIPSTTSAAGHHGTPSAAAQPVRTTPQPVSGHAPPHGQAQHPNAAQGRPWPAPGDASQPQGHSSHPGGFTRSSSVGQAPSVGWQTLLSREGAAATEADEVYTGKLENGQAIDFKIDRLTGSARQSQKRHRNAEASNRHRSKRKAQASDYQNEIDRLVEAREADQAKIETLIRERDFYRDERNRLRDLARRTPQIAQWAEGPPTPTGLGMKTHSTPEHPGEPRSRNTTSGRQESAAHPVHIVHEVRQAPSGPRIESQPPGRAPSVPSLPDARPAMSHMPIPGQQGQLPSPAFGNRPHALSRVASATQLPPIGAMSGPVSPFSPGQPWEPGRSQDHQERPNPGWAAGQPR